MPVENKSKEKSPLPCLDLADRMIDESVEPPVAQKIAKDVVQWHPSTVAYRNPAARLGLGLMTDGLSELAYRWADSFCEATLNDWESLKTGKTN